MPVPVMPVFGMVGMVGVRTAVPAMRSAHASRSECALARTSSAQARQGAGDGLGGVVLCGVHDSILHAT